MSRALFGGEFSPSPVVYGPPSKSCIFPKAPLAINLHLPDWIMQCVARAHERRQSVCQPYRC